MISSRAASALLFMSLSQAWASPAWACKCALVPYDKVVAQTPVVFDGEVVRSERDADGERQITSFRVWGAVKGVSQRLVPRPENALKRTPQRMVTVISRLNAAECGWDFSEGARRLIVGATRDQEGILVATRCTMYNLNRRP
jgi:hypothetical protein